MPAKLKQLPRPCPKCRKTSGTMQIILFRNSYDDSIVCRIGHYDADGYRKINDIIKERKLNPRNTNSSFKEDIHTKQRQWCSFRINGEFAKLHIDNIDNFFDRFGAARLGSKKSITFSALKIFNLYQAIKDSGWHALPNWSDRYRGRREVHGKKVLKDPRNRDESVVMGFIGIQCIKCNSWRTRPHTSVHNLLRCGDCGHMWKKYS